MNKFLNRIIIRWRYNQLVALADKTLSMSYNCDLVLLELQNASKLIIDAAKIMKQASKT